jgi:hypothetical protein
MFYVGITFSIMLYNGLTLPITAIPQCKLSKALHFENGDLWAFPYIEYNELIVKKRIHYGVCKHDDNITYNSI